MFFYEANISTKQYKEVSCPRLSYENEHQGWKKGSHKKEGQGPEKACSVARRMVRSCSGVIGLAHSLYGDALR